MDEDWRSAQGMNWRRGLLFATIHLAIAASLLVWEESLFWPYIGDGQNRPSTMNSAVGSSPQYSFGECEQGAGWDGLAPPPDQILTYADLPAVVIMGSHIPCAYGDAPVDLVVEKRFGRTHKSEVIIAAIYCGVIVIQWFLIGCFRLVLWNRWWLDPGTFITLSAPVVTVIVSLPAVSRLPPYSGIWTLLVWAYSSFLVCRYGLGRIGVCRAARAHWRAYL